MSRSLLFLFVTPPLSRLAVMCLLVVGGCLGLATQARAIAYDFTTFGVDRFPTSSGLGIAVFPQAAWTLTPSTATHNNNANATILYSPTSALNKKITGTLRAGTDDDVVGFVLGYQPGDAMTGSSSKYLLLDWKGLNQNFDFTDPVGTPPFHVDTPGGVMPAGLALSEVTGLPTNDELWQHVNFLQSNSGGVTQLARGATLGSSSYSVSGTHQFEIHYTATNITVLVDGVEQFNVNGSFPDGRFGLYSAWQGPTPTFSDFDVVDIGFEDLRAVVDRSTGQVTLENPGSVPLSFDYYQLSSLSHSLTPGTWNSLSDQNFQPSGPGLHQQWQEMGGSDSLNLGEVRLSSQSTLAAAETQAIGLAYNNAIDGQDLVLEYRAPGGQVKQGTVTYIGIAPPDLEGDFNNDGVVDAADYVVWRNNLGGEDWVLNGNGDNSGTVDTGDYTLWKANFGATAPGGLALSAATVPEPATVALLMGAIASLAGTSRLRRHFGQRA